MAGPPPLPPDIRKALADQLSPGERVLWAAQPSASRQRASFAIWLFAIPWTVLACFWEAMALMPLLAETHGPPLVKWGFGIVFPIFGLPFIAVGAAMLYVPIHAMRKAGTTVHALTDRRLVTLTTGPTLEAKSAWVDRIGPITRREGRDGWGSLKIETHSKLDSDGDRQTATVDLIGIPDVAGLERLLIAAQAK